MFEVFEEFILKIKNVFRDNIFPLFSSYYVMVLSILKTGFSNILDIVKHN